MPLPLEGYAHPLEGYAHSLRWEGWEDEITCPPLEDLA